MTCGRASATRLVGPLAARFVLGAGVWLFAADGVAQDHAPSQSPAPSPEASRGEGPALPTPVGVTRRSGPATGGTLHIDDVIRLALARNERSRQAALRGVVAQGQVGRARAAFLPTLVASGSGTWTVQEDRNGRSFSSGGALTLTQPLLDLSAFAAMAQARSTRDAERWGGVEDRRALAFDAARGFLEALNAERLVDAATRRKERADASEQATAARVEAGLSSTNDLTRAKLETASAAREVAQSKGQLTRAYLTLGFVAGEPVEGRLAASESTTREAETGIFRVAEVARAAEARRPDVQEARSRRAAAQDAADEPLYRLVPTLDAQARVTFDPDSIAPDPGHAEQVSLNLSWVVFDAGLRYADRRSRLAALESAALTEQQLLRSIRTDAGSAVASLEAARAAYALAGQAVAAAARNSEETQILYQQGLARAIELTDANAQRYDAEVGRETARLSMEQAYLELRFALGLEPTGRPIRDVAATPEATR